MNVVQEILDDYLIARSMVSRWVSECCRYGKKGSVAKVKNKIHYLCNIQVHAEIPRNLFISRVTENPERFPAFRVLNIA